MDENEINAIMEKLRSGVELTSEELRKLDSASADATKKLKEYGQTLAKTAAEASVGLVKLAGMGDAGANSFKTLNPVIDGVAKTAKGTAAAIGSLGEGIPVLGGVLRAFGKAVGVASDLIADGSKYMLAEMDRSAQAFNDFSKVGALTVKGMSGLQQQFVRSGMTLDSFKKTVMENASEMSRFRGTVGQGAEDFSKVVGDLIDSDLGKELRRIGFSADQIGEGAAGFIKQQTQLGLSQRKSVAELTAGSAEYLRQQDLLAKATGASRKAIEDQQQAALSEGRFRAITDEMVANGQERQAKTLLDFQTMVAKAAPEMGAGLRDAASGFTASAASQKLFMDTGGAATDIIERVKSGQIDQIQAFKELQAATRTQIVTTRDITKAVGDEAGVFSKYADRSNLANAKIVDGMVQLQDAQKQQMAKGTDPLTDATVGAQEAMQQMNRQMQQFGFKIMPQAAAVVEGFTSTVNAFIKKFGKASGIELPGEAERIAKEEAAQRARVAQTQTFGERVSSRAQQAGENVIGGIPLLGFLKEILSTRREQNELAEANRRLAELPRFAEGGITSGLSFAGEAGPEAVIPLKGGKVPVDLGGLSAKMGGAGLGTTATDLNKSIVGMTKAMVPFTEALNTFTTTVSKSAIRGVGEGEKALAGEGIFSKMISFITNLFDGGGPGGGRAATPQATAQEALAAHDHAHPHGEKGAAVSPEVAKQISAGFVNPLEKMVQTSGFGTRTMGGKLEGHGAIDFAGKIGDKIMAPVKGVARVLTEAESGGYGNMVEITDSITGFKHILAHMDKTLVKTGDVIDAGTQIGTVGSTGRSTGAHLHHEMRDAAGNKIDPSQFYKGVVDTQGRPISPPGFGSTAGGAAVGYPHLARPGMAGELGSMSQKYESGTAGTMAVGRDRSGGTSYGKYQIASKVGSMDSFLQLLKQNDPEAHARLMSAGPQDAGAEGKFAQEWKKLAGEGRIQKSEREFAVDKIFKPAMGGLKDQDLSKMIEGNKGLQEMMFSMAIQHGPGGAPAILNKVFKKGMSAEQLTEAAYAERGAEGGQRYFGKSSEAERAGVVSRFGREKQDVLAMLGMPGGAPGMPAGPVPGVAPTMVAGAAPAAPVAAGQSPMQSLLSSLLGPQIGGAIGSLAGPVLPTAAGVAAPESDLVAAIKEQGSVTSTAITTSIASLKDSLSGGGAVASTQVPDLLNELISAQRDQTSAINRLIQVQTA